MEFIQTLPIWALVLVIFLLRVVDVTMGTMRTLAIVQGKISLSVVLGFFEVLVWVVVVSQVVTRLQESFFLALAYAGGFASGNAVGILVERRIAMGSMILRIFSHRGEQLADTLRKQGQVVTTFSGQGRDGPVSLVYCSCPRRQADKLLRLARGVDPDLVYIMERVNAWGHGRDVIAAPTGWRAFWKKK